MILRKLLIHLSLHELLNIFNFSQIKINFHHIIIHIIETFRYHPLVINVNPEYIIHTHTHIQVPVFNLPKAERSKSGKRFHALTLKMFVHTLRLHCVYISLVQHDSSQLINCSRKLESVAKSSSYGYLPTPWWPCRVERDRRHYLLVSRDASSSRKPRSSMLIDHTPER